MLFRNFTHSRVIKEFIRIFVFISILVDPSWARLNTVAHEGDRLLLYNSKSIPNRSQFDTNKTAPYYASLTMAGAADTHLVKTLTQLRQGDDWSDQLKQIYIYNEKGLCEQVVDYVNGNHWVAKSREVNSYDSLNRLFERLEQRNDAIADWTNYRKYSYFYNAANQLYDIIIERWWEGKWNYYRRYTSTFNAEGLLVEEIEYGSYTIDPDPWRLVHKTIFSYNDFGQLSMFVTYRPFGHLWVNKKKGLHTYRLDGKIVEFVQHRTTSNFPEIWELEFTEAYFYNELDQLAKVDYSFEGYTKRRVITTHEYDENGKLSKDEVEASTNGSIDEITQTFYFYDDYAEDELKYYGNQAEYLIIAPPQFHNSLLDYACFRRDYDLNTMIVGTEQIYAEFTDAYSDQTAIREFISYTQKYWAEPKPKYVLLVGDTDLIPAYAISSSIENEGPIPIDEWYTVNQFEEDSFPDLVIGRWPVQNESELELIIQKTMAFESGQGLSQSFKKLMFLNDEDTNPATQTVFEDLSATFISTILPPYIQADRIDIRADSPFNDSKQSFINKINDGIGHLIYYGPGASTSWSRQNYLTIDDLSLLEPNNLPFLVSTMGCSQNFDKPDEQSLVEELLLFANGGAVATIASSGLNSYITGDKFISNVYSRLIQEPGKTLGEIILEVKLNTYTENIKADDMTRRFTLLGDPCLKAPFWTITDISAMEQKHPTDFIVNQNYPNPFNPSTTIQFNIPVSGQVDFAVYNVLGKAVHSLKDQLFSAGSHTLTINAQDWPSGIYYYQIRFGRQSDTKKCLLIR